MVQLNNNNQTHSKNSFLKKNFDKNKITQRHKDFLGLDLPDDYFSKSKKEILEVLPKNLKSKTFIFGLRPLFAYPIAATLLLLLGITIWFQYPKLKTDFQVTEVEKIETKKLEASSDSFLINSLLVENSEVNDFMDTYIIDEIIVETNDYENKLDAILIDSFFIKDSLLDVYFKETLLDNLIL